MDLWRATRSCFRPTRRVWAISAGPKFGPALAREANKLRGVDSRDVARDIARQRSARNHRECVVAKGTEPKHPSRRGKTRGPLRGQILVPEGVVHRQEISAVAVWHFGRAAISRAQVALREVSRTQVTRQLEEEHALSGTRPHRHEQGRIS